MQPSTDSPTYLVQEMVRTQLAFIYSAEMESGSRSGERPGSFKESNNQSSEVLILTSTAQYSSSGMLHHRSLETLRISITQLCWLWPNKLCKHCASGLSYHFLAAWWQWPLALLFRHRWPEFSEAQRRPLWDSDTVSWDYYFTIVASIPNPDHELS